MNRPSLFNPPPPTRTGSSSYPFAPDTPASRSDTSVSSDSPPVSPMPLVHFQKLAQRGNGPLDAIQRMRRECLRGGPSGVSEARYTASIDDRAYIPVYEFPLEHQGGTQTIMIDSDTGFVLWTAIWKSLGNNKADIVKLAESYEGLEEKIIKIRGGFLKIQGTWTPYEVALLLAQRVAYNIRYSLVPLFGPTFPDECFAPTQLGYGQVTLAVPGSRAPRRVPRRMTGPSLNGSAVPKLGRPAAGSHSDWPNGPTTGVTRPSRSNSLRSIGSSQSGHTVPSSSGGSTSERWSPYPHPHPPSTSTHHPSEYARSTHETFNHNSGSPRPAIQSPPSSFPPASSHGHGSGFILPSPNVPGVDTFHRSQHSESSLPRSRQATYSQDDVQVLRRFTTTVGGSPPRRDFPALAPLGRPIEAASSGSSLYRAPAPPPFSLPPISSMTGSSVSSSSSSRSFHQVVQSQVYRIPSAAEQSRRRQRSPSATSSVATSSSDSHEHHYSSQGHGSSNGTTPLTSMHPSPYHGYPPSSTSSTHSSFFESSSTSSVGLPPLSTAVFDAHHHHRAEDPGYYPPHIAPSPASILRSLRVRDPSPPRLHLDATAAGDGGVAMEIDRSSSSEKTQLASTSPDEDSSDHHPHRPFVGGLGVYFPQRREREGVHQDRNSRDVVSGDGARVGTAEVKVVGEGEGERQRSTSFRPW